MFSSLSSLTFSLAQSLLYLPFALANALTARLNDGYVSFLSLFRLRQIHIRIDLNPLLRVPLVDEFWVLLGYCIFTLSLYAHFATSVIHEITTALGIYCFRLELRLRYSFFLPFYCFKFTKFDKINLFFFIRITRKEA